MMQVFRKMATAAAGQLLGTSAGHCISIDQLACLMEQIALHDAELAEHYARMAAMLPALRAQRAAEDAEIESARGSCLG